MEAFATPGGMFRPTLSRSFNDPGSARQSLRGRIEAALKQCACTPNVHAIHRNRHPTRVSCPSLTTVSQDDDSIAQRSMELLLSIIASGQRPDTKRSTLFDGAPEMRRSA
jgi:DNA-binding LacI/PurR family transcriptional regulator